MASTDNTQSRGGGRGRGRAYWRGRGNFGGGRGGKGKGPSEQDNEEGRKPARARPTHFLALPLHNFPALRSQIGAFQAALFDEQEAPDVTEVLVQAPESAPSAGGSDDRPKQHLKTKKVRYSGIVEGLDSTIVIDPVRMHMTLGVMALEPDSDGDLPSDTYRKTVSSALALLRSLKPQLSTILEGGKEVKVPLEVLDVLKPSYGSGKGKKTEAETEKLYLNSNLDASALGTNKAKVSAGVLFVGPRHVEKSLMDLERRKLMDVCDLVHKTFTDAGYITERRPLKLHCTILNASHRKPSRWYPFSYSDILASQACSLIRLNDEEPGKPIEEPAVEGKAISEGSTTKLSKTADKANAAAVESEKAKTSSTYRPPIVAPTALPVKLGTWDVKEVQLWIMGSRDKEGRYISCGGVELG